MITLLGWIGAVLALAAYAQTGTARLRQIALASSVALLTFNMLLGIWSNVVLESALVVVNTRRLLQLRVGSRPALLLGAIPVPPVPKSNPVSLVGCDVSTTSTDLAPDRLPQRAGGARSVLLECPRWDSNPHALSDNGF